VCIDPLCDFLVDSLFDFFVDLLLYLLGDTLLDFLVRSGLNTEYRAKTRITAGRFGAYLKRRLDR
jgi:hypothetical protein